jgi:hypothetical protein
MLPYTKWPPEQTKKYFPVFTGLTAGGISVKLHSFIVLNITGTCCFAAKNGHQN